MFLEKPIQYEIDFKIIVYVPQKKHSIEKIHASSIQNHTMRGYALCEDPHYLGKADKPNEKCISSTRIEKFAPTSNWCQYLVYFDVNLNFQENIR